jgi:hypothetical protein
MAFLYVDLRYLKLATKGTHPTNTWITTNLVSELGRSYFCNLRSQIDTGWSIGKDNTILPIMTAETLITAFVRGKKLSQHNNTCHLHSLSSTSLNILST